MSGLRLPEVKEVPTAKQHWQKLLKDDQMNNLPGSLMSLGQMFQGLMGGLGGGGGGGGGAPAGGAGGAPAPAANNEINFGTGYDYSRNRMDEITSKMTPQMKDAVNSLSTLMQGFDSTGSEGSYVTGGRVHVPTYLDNSASLISQATNIYELMDVMHRLQNDESLFGTEKLEPQVFDVTTYEGSTKQYVYANGYITLDQTPAMQNNQNNFASSAGSPSTAPSGGGSGNGGMFGDQMKNIMDMLKRVSPEAEKKQKEVIEKVTSGNHGRKSNPIVKALTDGKNPVKDEVLNQGG
jgi:hypothetical protein